MVAVSRRGPHAPGILSSCFTPWHRLPCRTGPARYPSHSVALRAGRSNRHRPCHLVPRMTASVQPGEPERHFSGPAGGRQALTTSLGRRTKEGEQAARVLAGILAQTAGRRGQWLYSRRQPGKTRMDPGWHVQLGEPRVEIGLPRLGWNRDSSFALRRTQSNMLPGFVSIRIKP